MRLERNWMAVAGDDARGLANVPSAAAETGVGPLPETRLPLLMLGALGVVYGDIGTSPIYAFREALHAADGRRAAARARCSAFCR